LQDKIIFIGNSIGNYPNIEQQSCLNCLSIKIKHMNIMRNVIAKLLPLAILAFLVAIPADSDAVQGETIRINPEFKINRVSNGAVIVTTKDPKEVQVKHEFKDFYADLLFAASRKQRMDYITDTLKKKYYLSEDDCRREIKHALNVLAEWNIVLRDNSVALQ